MNQNEKDMSLYAYLAQYAKDNHGHLPTLRTIVEDKWTSSFSHAGYILRRLAKAGFLDEIKEGGKTHFVITGGEYKLPTRANIAIMEWIDHNTKGES